MFGNPGGRDEIQKSFENEVRAISKLCRETAHPHIVSVFRQGEVKDSALYYIDMELCNGNLDQFIRDRGASSSTPIIIADVWDIMVQITSGLAHIHSQGEVHRDIKPRNSKRVE
jgi:eukaryotic-like serine/threonine-protein kinase